jgi:hypothetical protein
MRPHFSGLSTSVCPRHAVCCAFICIALMLLAGNGAGERTPTLLAVASAPAKPADSLIGPIPLMNVSETHHAGRAEAHPHGDRVCASGCALSRHPTKRLTDQRFEELMQRLVRHPADEGVHDELLYYGPQTKVRMLADNSRAANHIPEIIRARLLRELKRTHVTVALRLTSESGVILAELPEQLIPLDLRHEFDLQEDGIPPLLASGTIKRVGSDRLWSRL